MDGPWIVDPPSAVFVLVFQDVARGLGQALGIARAQQNMQHDVIGFERGIGFQFATPVAFFVLLGKQAVARAVNGRSHPADQIINFSEAHLRHSRGGRQGGGMSSIICYRYSTAAPLGAAAMASTISGGKPKPYVLRHDLDFLHVGEAFGPQELHDFFDQAFRSGSARGQRDGLHPLQPFRPDIAEAVN